MAQILMIIKPELGDYQNREFSTGEAEGEMKLPDYLLYINQRDEALYLPSKDYCVDVESDDILLFYDDPIEFDICICIYKKFCWFSFFNSVNGAKVVVLKFDGG
ncbi:MAG: hypothetical protein EZS28_006120 [Streblomastix strix]|uniref:Uncharacterized protein n=1 Tax=Streblomastix strix TaxID=222440 RepID=A0A5J4WTQ1_9EUKA|nr:MAG: hypothetical protein EZS28_006120 [Streblomastix strix]